MPDRRLMPLSRWNITFFYHQKDGCKISQTCFCCQKHDIFSYSSVKNTHFYCLKDGWACPEVPLETTCLLLAENGCQQLSSGYLARTHVACNPPSLYGRNVDMMWVKQSSVCQWFAETFSRLTSALPGLKKKTSSAAWHQSSTQSKVRRPFKQLNFQQAYAALSPWGVTSMRYVRLPRLNAAGIQSASFSRGHRSNETITLLCPRSPRMPVFHRSPTSPNERKKKKIYLHVLLLVLLCYFFLFWFDPGNSTLLQAAVIV